MFNLRELRRGYGSSGRQAFRAWGCSTSTWCIEVAASSPQQARRIRPEHNCITNSLQKKSITNLLIHTNSRRSEKGPAYLLTNKNLPTANRPQRLSNSGKNLFSSIKSCELGHFPWLPHGLHHSGNMSANSAASTGQKRTSQDQTVGFINSSC